MKEMLALLATKVFMVSSGQADRNDLGDISGNMETKFQAVRSPMETPQSIQKRVVFWKQ